MTNSTIAMSEKEASRIPILNDLLEKNHWSRSMKIDRYQWKTG